MTKLIVSLTTIDSRLGSVHLVINSLLAQEFDACPFEIRLHISNTPYLLDKGCQTLTDELRGLLVEGQGKFSIKYVDNTGPYRKIIPVLEEVYQYPERIFLDTLIVTVDDDTVYPKDFLSRLYDAYALNKCVIAFRGRAIRCENGRLSKYRQWRKEIFDNPSLLNVPTGKDGVLYSTRHLHPDVRNINNAIKYAPKADDLWLKVHALLCGTPSLIISDSLSNSFPSVDTTEPEVSLYSSFNERGGNDVAISMLGEYLATEHNCSFAQLLESPDVQLFVRSIDRVIERSSG